jgi:glycine oxidase
MKAHPEVFVAGAGALGLATALALADAGAKVTVFDPAPLADNASGVAAGMLAPACEAVLDPSARPHLDLLLAARDLWPDLARRVGITLDRTGALALGDAARLDRLEAQFADLGLAARRLGAEAAADAAPGARAVAGGLLTRDDWRLDAPAALAALARAAEAAGVRRVQAPLDLAGPADLRVIAVGADRALAAVAPELSLVTPIKGHILRAPAVTYAGPVLRGEGAYIAPGAQGVIVGATMEAGLADRVVDAGRVAALRAAAAAILPAVAEAEVVATTGVRGATPDGLPLVGASVAPGVVLAVGARRNGWLLAPLVARIVVDHALGRDPSGFAERLFPGRFDATSAVRA